MIKVATGLRKLACIGFDVHGIITGDPESFADLMGEMYQSGQGAFDVVIVTGMREYEVRKELKSYGIHYGEHYGYVLSVVDYLLRQKEDYRVEFTEKGHEHYYFDEFVWNSAKADLCLQFGIDMLIDDTEVYGKYFGQDHPTKFILKKD